MELTNYQHRLILVALEEYNQTLKSVSKVKPEVEKLIKKYESR